MDTVSQLLAKRVVIKHSGFIDIENIKDRKKIIYLSEIVM